MKKKKKIKTNKPGDLQKKWFEVDASGKILGRLATRVATILCGKHKPAYVAHVDTGDYVVIINAEKIRVSGKKSKQKLYFKHSGYPGGQTLMTYAEMQAKHPARIIEAAVAGMLPKGKLGRVMLKKLKVVVGSKHLFQAQQLKKIEV